MGELASRITAGGDRSVVQERWREIERCASTST